MAQQVKVKLNNAGVIELFKSASVQGWLGSLGAQVARTAGEDYSYDVRAVGGTALVIIFPDSVKAAHDNYENNSLLKAVGTVGQIGAKPKL